MPTHRIIISSLPASRFSITDIQYRFDGGSAISLGGNTAGTYNITLPGLDHLVEIRAVSSAGPGPWSVAEYTDFNVAASNMIFPAGQVGGWLDPYDLTTMWQDSAGTIPMTLANLGTGVGRCITKGNAITLVQANAADRPVWGRHPVSGIRNLFERTEELSNAYWTKSRSTVATATAQDGTQTATKIIGSSGLANTRDVRATISTTGQLTFSVIAKQAEYSGLFLYLNIDDKGQRFDLATGAIAGVVNNAPTNATITALGDGWYKCTITATSTVSQSMLIGILPTAASGINFIGDDTSGVLVWRPQIEAGPTATTYQRVTNRFDITEVGQPDLYYFDFNGVNQSWASNATVNFSTTNKVTVWAGVHKRSDAATGVLLEHTSLFSNPGAFTIAAPALVGSNSYALNSTGTITVAVAPGPIAPAPDTSSIILESSISQPLLRLWRNGAIVGSNTTSQGTGNYSNATLFIGRRNNTTLPFNGRLYSSIIAGDNYDTRTIQRFSDWLLKPRRLITA